MAATGVVGCVRWRGPLRPIQRRAFSTRQTGDPVRLSAQFIPTTKGGEIAEEHLQSVKLLLQGGYIRQSSSGFFSYLPLGLRVLNKVQAIVEDEMEQVRHTTSVEKG